VTFGRLVARMLGVPSVRALRGATTVAHDDPASIADAVTELLVMLQRENHLLTDEVVSAIFTMTPDLRTAFPAETARHLGWRHVPLICASEIEVPDAMPRCLRVLLHVERNWSGHTPRHVYLRDATRLRPDLAVTRETAVQSART
jgi:chorismate mutase